MWIGATRPLRFLALQYAVWYVIGPAFYWSCIFSRPGLAFASASTAVQQLTIW